MANLQRASIYAIEEETTSGTPVSPSGATSFVPLKTGFAMTAAIEELTNDEISNNLGAAKSLTGKETPSGSHGIYLKNSEVEGQAPEYGLMIESCLGAKSVAAAEYNTVAASTTSVIKVDAGEGSTFETGECLLLKDGTNGYSIRNITSVSTDDLNINYNLGTAPGVGVDLGKAVLYKPATTGHPTFTSWMYRANGAAVEMIAGCKVNSMNMTFTAGQQAECEFSYEGTGYYFNPVTVDATNNKLDITDDGGTIVATLTNGVYKDPIEFASMVNSVVGAALLASGGDDFSCTYSSTDGKFTLVTTTGTLLSFLWLSGVNNANGAYALLGFDKVDETGALTYTSDSGMSYAPSYTGSYDDADNIVVKSAELFIGDATDNVCRKASVVNIAIDSPSTDSDSICSASGLFEKVATSRTVTMTTTLVLASHEAHLFNKYLNGTTTQAMMNIGPKSGGNWVPGKCVNVYFGNATITGHVVGGDDFVTLELTVKGFITSDKEDVYLNFC